MTGTRKHLVSIWRNGAEVIHFSVEKKMRKRREITRQATTKQQTALETMGNHNSNSLLISREEADIMLAWSSDSTEIKEN